MENEIISSFEKWKLKKETIAESISEDTCKQDFENVDKIIESNYYPSRSFLIVRAREFVGGPKECREA